MVFDDEKQTRLISEKRLTLQKDEEETKLRASLLNVFNQIGDETKELNLLIKADTQGSIEALRSVLGTIKVEGLEINIIRASVGARSEEHTSELQSRGHLVCRLLLEKKNTERIQLRS